jgi:hypothetical protein
MVELVTINEALLGDSPNYHKNIYFFYINPSFKIIRASTCF